jgi:putative MATE family efflux protein
VWPVALTGWLRTGYLLTNAWFVAGLGDEALAAVGAASFAWWVVLLLAELPAIAAHSLVAHQVGAGARSAVPETMAQAGWVGLGMTALLLGLVPVIPIYLGWVGLTPGSLTADLAEAYLLPLLLGGLVIVAQSVITGVFRGLGDTRASMVVTLLGFLLNALLDPPAIAVMGIAGAAWAVVISHGLSAALGLAWLYAQGLRLRYRPPERATMARIVAIGAPVSARGIAFSLIYVVLGRMVVSFGEAELAGLVVGQRLEGMAYQLCVAFEVAAATLVGQQLGAGQPRAAAAAAHRAAWVGSLVMVPAMALLLGGAWPLIDLFSPSEATTAAGASYLQIQALFFVFMALESVYGGAFAGAARTGPPFVIVSLGTLLRLPLAWALAWPAGLGVDGIWLAIALSTVGKGILSAWWWRRSFS